MPDVMDAEKMKRTYGDSWNGASVAEDRVEFMETEMHIHHMRLQPSPFGMIKSGEKTIELRLFDEKRQQIKEGDRIVFTQSETGETLQATVLKLHRFDTFGELYSNLPLLQCGYTVDDVKQADPSDMEQYYSAAEQKKYGVIGIELRLTNGILV